MQKSGIILLTSTGLSVSSIYDKFKAIADYNKFTKAVIITTAAEDKENNQYSKLALSQIKSAGLTVVDFYDFEKDGYKDLSKYDIIYVCGGNTFKLMKFARTNDFDKEINKLLRRGGFYIGVSAGSIILGPSIKIANEINPDENNGIINDFSGFNVLDFIVFTHYSNEFESDIKKFEHQNHVAVNRISNYQAILISDGTNIIIE
jgi:dipeptidase E